MKFWTLHEALVYGKGVERPFLCPVHGDSRPSASVNVVKGAWYCYSCGAKGGITGEDALIEPDYQVMRRWFDQKMEEHRVYPESWLARWDAGEVHPYWARRVGVPAARHFRLGYDAEADAGTYPLREWDGTVLGVVRRNFKDEGPKYLYPRGLDISQYLFNYSQEQRKVVFLVEGAMDAIALWNIGVHAFAIYGSRLSETQIQLIERVDPQYIVTAFDNDDAGFRAYCDVERAFKHRLVERMRWPASWGKDVDEIGPDHLKNVVLGLASPVMLCVSSSSCRSAESTKTESPLKIQRSRSTSTPRRLTILRNSA